MIVEYEKYLEYKEIISKNEQLLTSDDTKIKKNYNPKSATQSDVNVVVINSSSGRDSSISSSPSSISLCLIMKSNDINNKHKTKRNIIKKRISEWSKSITAHGLPNIFLSKKAIIKVLWSLAFVASISYCIINIYREIVKYVSYEYTTHLETVDDAPALFPAITVCNINPLITTEAERLVEKVFKNTYNIDLSENYTHLKLIELIEKLEHGKSY